LQLKPSFGGGREKPKGLSHQAVVEGGGKPAVNWSASHTGGTSEKGGEQRKGRAHRNKNATDKRTSNKEGRGHFKERKSLLMKTNGSGGEHVLTHQELPPTRTKRVELEKTAWSLGRCGFQKSSIVPGNHGTNGKKDKDAEGQTWARRRSASREKRPGGAGLRVRGTGWQWTREKPPQGADEIWA